MRLPRKTQSKSVQGGRFGEARVIRWLVGFMKKNPKREAQWKSQKEFFKEAKALFHGLSDRSFKKAWSAAAQKAPSEWCKPGRRPKIPRV
jgi:hypothetical protein